MAAEQRRENQGFIMVSGRPTESRETRSIAIAGTKAMALLLHHAVSSALSKCAVQRKR